MILDNVKNIKLYNLDGNFKTAFDFIVKTDLNTLPVGKTEVDGKNVYVAVSEYLTKLDEGDFEAHDNYADIQIILSGNEIMDWCERKDCFNTTEYNAEKDVVKMNTNASYTRLKVKTGQFAIFFPEDAHRPNMSDGEQKQIKKAVVKVKIN